MNILLLRFDGKIHVLGGFHNCYGEPPCRASFASINRTDCRFITTMCPHRIRLDKILRVRLICLIELGHAKKKSLQICCLKSKNSGTINRSCQVLMSLSLTEKHFLVKEKKKIHYQKKSPSLDAYDCTSLHDYTSPESCLWRKMQLSPS